MRKIILILNQSIFWRNFFFFFLTEGQILTSLNMAQKSFSPLQNGIYVSFFIYVMAVCF